MICSLFYREVLSDIGNRATLAPGLQGSSIRDDYTGVVFIIIACNSVILIGSNIYQAIVYVEISIFIYQNANTTIFTGTNY